MAASKRRWPLGRGFERFYGFLGGESSCWYPDLIHDNHPVDPPATPEEGYHIAKDLSDQAIRFIRDAKVVEPDKPFFMYFSLDAAHAPHHVFREWADKYKGRFDQGYEAIRAEILARQKELGLLPDDTELSPINPHGEPAVDRAGRPAVADARHGAAMGLAQRGREATLRPDGRGVRRLRLVHRRPGRAGHRLPGVLRRARQHHHRRRLRQRCERRRRPERDVQRVALLQRGAYADRAAPCSTSTSSAVRTSYNHYNTGWAWAFDTPFPYWKRWAGYEGGIADMCMVSWPAKVAPQSRPRQQYVHAVDVVPDDLRAASAITPPETLRGYRAEPDRR